RSGFRRRGNAAGVAARPCLRLFSPSAGAGMMTIQARIWRIALCAFLFAVTALVLFPILWMVLTSIKPEREIYSFVPKWLPTKIDWSHYRVVWFEKNFWLYFLNSIFVASVTALVSTVVATLGGYALARFSFRGRT